ncbi:MAG: hypothetical protein K8R88_05000 [Armatimonadetes bacterium]|nr:hypothetical protein [Armatimonadota bacterium]
MRDATSAEIRTGLAIANRSLKNLGLQPLTEKNVRFNQILKFQPILVISDDRAHLTICIDMRTQKCRQLMHVPDDLGYNPKPRMSGPKLQTLATAVVSKLKLHEFRFDHYTYPPEPTAAQIASKKFHESPTFTAFYRQFPNGYPIVPDITSNFLQITLDKYSGDFRTLAVVPQIFEKPIVKATASSAIAIARKGVTCEVTQRYSPGVEKFIANRIRPILAKFPKGKLTFLGYICNMDIFSQQKNPHRDHYRLVFLVKVGQVIGLVDTSTGEYLGRY